MADNPSSGKLHEQLVDDTPSQLWIASHIVEVTRPITLATRRVPCRHGWMAAAL